MTAQHALLRDTPRSSASGKPSGGKAPESSNTNTTSKSDAPESKTAAAGAESKTAAAPASKTAATTSGPSSGTSTAAPAAAPQTLYKLPIKLNNERVVVEARAAQEQNDCTAKEFLMPKEVGTIEFH